MPFVRDSAPQATDKNYQGPQFGFGKSINATMPVSPKWLGYFKNFIQITIPTLIILFLLLELLFRFGIPACENPNYILEEEFQIIKHNSEFRKEGVYTMGTWGGNPAPWKINSDGWLSPVDYNREKTKPRIAVIGDSYVAALEVNTGEAFHQLLAEYLEEEEVYSFGVSGAPLSQYFQMAKYVEANFEPDILIINLIYNDFDESITQLTGRGNPFWTCELQKDSSFQMSPPEINDNYKTIKNWAVKSALFRYLIYNIHIHKWKKRKLRLNRDNYHLYTDRHEKVEKHKAVIEKMILFVLTQFKNQFPDKRIIFMMDGPRRAIYNDWYKQSSLIWLNDFCRLTCQKLGFEFIDLIPHFVKDYQQNKTNFEFPEDNHWNAYGHQFVSKVLFEYLARDSSLQLQY